MWGFGRELFYGAKRAVGASLEWRLLGRHVPPGAPHIGKALHPPLIDHQRVGAPDGAAGGAELMAPFLQQSLGVSANTGLNQGAVGPPLVVHAGCRHRGGDGAAVIAAGSIRLSPTGPLTWGHNWRHSAKSKLGYCN